MSPAEFCDLTDPCYAGREWALANCQDMGEAWANARPDWLVWIATRKGVLDDLALRRFSAWSARQVQHLMTDPRSLAVLDVAERYADGQATDEELAAALAAAWDARDAAVAVAAAAARDAAVAAALAVARAAARDAAVAAALAAAWAAAWDARDAAVAVARAAAVAAALAAARDAAWDARAAARDAARDAAWDAQAAWLRANATPDWERARKMGGAR